MKKHDRKLRREEMAYHIQSWKESGQSQHQYCLSNNLRFNTFYYWLKKERARSNLLTDGFIPIRVQNSITESASNVEIQYPNGVRILVQSPDVQFIGRLVWPIVILFNLDFMLGTTCHTKSYLLAPVVILNASNTCQWSLSGSEVNGERPAAQNCINVN